MNENELLVAGSYIRINSMIVKGFMKGSENIGQRAVEIMVDIDGETKEFTLDEFKQLVFGQSQVALATVGEPPPAYKAPLQALRMVGKKEEIFAATKKITIRAGERDYKEGKVMIGDEKECWCILKTITKVQRKLLKEVTKEEMIADGFKTQKSMLNGLKAFYPAMELHMPVTVIEWE